MLDWSTTPDFKLVPRGVFWDRFKCIKAGVLTWRYVDRRAPDVVQERIIIFELGWITDIASSPWWARPLVPQVGWHSPAAAAHDRALEMGWPARLARQLMIEVLKSLPKPKKIKEKIACWVTKYCMIAGVWIRDQFR